MTFVQNSLIFIWVLLKLVISTFKLSKLICDLYTGGQIGPTVCAVALTNLCSNDIHFTIQINLIFELFLLNRNDLFMKTGFSIHIQLNYVFFSITTGLR